MVPQKSERELKIKEDSINAVKKEKEPVTKPVQQQLATKPGQNAQNPKPSKKEEVSNRNVSNRNSQQIVLDLDRYTLIKELYSGADNWIILGRLLYIHP